MLVPRIVAFGATSVLFRGLILPMIERLNRKGHDFGVVGVCTGGMERFTQLRAQDGLYTLNEVGPDQERHELIESMPWVLHAQEDSAAVLEHLSRPETNLVTLSITQKGYHFRNGSYNIDLKHPDVIADVTGTDAPKTSLGMILRGLEARQQAGLDPFLVLPCENLPRGGHVIGLALLSMAQKRDQALGTSLAPWVQQHKPIVLNAMVDKICASGRHEYAMCYDGASKIDGVPVVAELFGRLVIQDDPRLPKVLPRELLETDWDGDFQFHITNDVGVHELAKLRMVNGGHRLLGFTGLLAGHETVDEAARCPEIRNLLQAFLTEAQATLPDEKAASVCFNPETLMQRFSNKALGDRLTRVATDSSIKLGPRLFRPLRDMVAEGKPHHATTFAVACWLNFLRGENDRGESFGFCDETGRPSILGDPSAESGKLVRAAQEVHAQWCCDSKTHPKLHPNVERLVENPVLKPLFGDLAEDSEFLHELGSALRVLYVAGRDGLSGDVRNAISQWLACAPSSTNPAPADIVVRLDSLDLESSAEANDGLGPEISSGRKVAFAH